MTTHRSVPIALPSVGDDEWQAIRAPLERGWLTQGPEVEAFEQAFAERHGVPHALATTSCTTAIHLALAALGVGPGDEVVVPAFTWVATANAVLYCGATPVFVDVDPRTYNLDIGLLPVALTPRTKAVVPVHLFGLCADMDAVRACVPHHIPLVEDGACAAGASYFGRPAGGIGVVGCFSFHPRKSITTGEGGMVTTADSALAARMAVLRNHGASVSAEHRHASAAPWELPDFDDLGFNYRMSDVQAAIGRAQLPKLDAFIAERAAWTEVYADLLADLPWLRLPEVPEGYGHAWQSYVTVVDADAPVGRNELMAGLQDRGVATRPGTHAVTELGLYRRLFDIGPGDFPVAARLQDRSMALPLHNRLVAADVEHVAAALHEVASATRRSPQRAS